MGASSSRTTPLNFFFFFFKLGQVWSQSLKRYAFLRRYDLLLWYWMVMVFFGRWGMLTCWRISIITVLQLDQSCRKQKKWVEVPYVLLFISLQDMSDLCPKGADLGVKFSSLLSSYFAPLSGVPNWKGWESGHLSRRGCLCLNRNSNSTNCGRDYWEDPKST